MTTSLLEKVLIISWWAGIISYACEIRNRQV